MDNLAREAMLARQAGMTYGQWKAMQPKQTEVKKEIPEGWIECEYCGQPFKKSYGKRFCDIYCRTKAYEPKSKVMQADYRKRWTHKYDEN